LSFPFILFALGFYDERELRKLGEIWRKLFAALKRRRLKQKPEIGTDERFDVAD
jgi:hypothetical protein